jgi:hypothetical protein
LITLGISLAHKREVLKSKKYSGARLRKKFAPRIAYIADTIKRIRKALLTGFTAYDT